MPELLGLSLFGDANLQAYYTLEDVNDDKNSNNLTNNNTATFVSAKFTNGVSGGSSDANKSLSIASALSYAGGAYAISFWVKIETDIADGTTYDFCELAHNTSDTSLLISYTRSGATRSLLAGRLRAGTAFDSISHNIDLGTSTYHHIVLTYDASTVRLYVNNVDVGNVASTGNGGAGGITADKFSILEGRTANNNSTLGIIDDTALFNRNLTAAEVSLIYSEPEVVGGFIHMSV